MMTDEQSTFFLAWVRELARQSGQPWEVDMDRERQAWRAHGRAMMGERGAEGCISLEFDSRTGRETRLVLSPTILDNDLQQYLPRDWHALTISVAQSRGPQVVARETIRRLLTPYLPLLCAARAQQADRRDHLARRHTLAVELAAVLGCTAPQSPRQDSTEYRAVRLEHALPRGRLVVELGWSRVDVQAVVQETATPGADLRALMQVLGAPGTE